MLYDRGTYFLIGGNGFIGNAFFEYLQKKNIPVQKILRGEISDNTSASFDNDFLERLPVSKTRNTIVDFAYTSVPNTSFSDPVKDFTENLYNVNNHLRFATKLSNPRYIYISSGGTVYGNTLASLPIKESNENNPLSPYGITKLAAEKYSQMHKAIHGLDIRIVRPSNIYGPGQRPLRGQGFISTAVAKIFMNDPIQLFGDGSAIRDYLYIDDFSDALFKIAEKGNSGQVYNIGSSYGLSTIEILHLIEEVLQVHSKVDYLPQRPFDVLYNVLDCTKMKSLNWKPQTTIEQGILQTAEWVKDYLSNFKVNSTRAVL